MCPSPPKGPLVRRACLEIPARSVLVPSCRCTAASPVQYVLPLLYVLYRRKMGPSFAPASLTDMPVDVEPRTPSRRFRPPNYPRSAATQQSLSTLLNLPTVPPGPVLSAPSRVGCPFDPQVSKSGNVQLNFSIAAAWVYRYVVSIVVMVIRRCQSNPLPRSLGVAIGLVCTIKMDE